MIIGCKARWACSVKPCLQIRPVQPTIGYLSIDASIGPSTWQRERHATQTRMGGPLSALSSVDPPILSRVRNNQTTGCDDTAFARPAHGRHQQQCATRGFFFSTGSAGPGGFDSLYRDRPKDAKKPPNANGKLHAARIPCTSPSRHGSPAISRLINPAPPKMAIIKLLFVFNEIDSPRDASPISDL